MKLESGACDEKNISYICTIQDTGIGMSPEFMSHLFDPFSQEKVDARSLLSQFKSKKKIYISADIEGIWGNSNPANTAKNGYLYSEYCTNMMNEVNLVIDLLFQNGVEEVVVNDSHGNMDNLLPSKLDPRAAFVSANGAYKEFGMMEGLDDSFDGALFIGYHSRCNSPGVMAHTIWGTMVRKIVVDGKELGESGINRLLANEFGVPVILASGDSEYGKQVEEELGCVFVETKKTLKKSLQ